jgi:phosphate acyltransferase
MRIALDAHGGDVGLARNISAAIETIDDPTLEVVLVGHQLQIEVELKRRSVAAGTFEILHAEEQIGMGDAAVQSIRRKSDNSITRAMELVKDGSVDAVVSAGHSGAVVAAALMTLGRLRGVSRPGLGTKIPTREQVAFCLDIGAVIDPKPEVMLQWGYLGACYSESVLGIRNPTVALLSNGEEASKGDALTRAARELFETASFNFVGYVEGRDMLHRPPHVTVTDGFTGNIALKTAEGTASYMASIIRRELTSSLKNKLLAALLRPTFRRMREQMDFEGIGGAPLLGVNGVVIVAHGHSTAKALVNAMRNAQHAAEVQLPKLLHNALPDDTKVSADPEPLVAEVTSS